MSYVIMPPTRDINRRVRSIAADRTAHLWQIVPLAKGEQVLYAATRAEAQALVAQLQ